MHEPNKLQPILEEIAEVILEKNKELTWLRMREQYLLSRIEEIKLAKVCEECHKVKEDKE